MPTAKSGSKAARPTTSPADETSTRELILNRSLELINSRGMVDFRIDTLASSLGLSPGNITYHFSRKEDICVTLWEQYLNEYSSVLRSLTTLLDIRQVYLMNRVNIQLNFKYRGVLVFRGSDLGAIARDAENRRMNETLHDDISSRVLALLTVNGYISAEIPAYTMTSIHDCHYIMMRWCINFAYQNYAPEDVEKELDHLALLSLHTMYPLFTEKGKAEFAEIMEKVENGQLLPAN